MKRFILFLLLPVSCYSATTFPPSNGAKNFFGTNTLSDAVTQTNTLIVSGFRMASRTNDISAANGTYIWNGTKYVFNTTNVISWNVAQLAWVFTNGVVANDLIVFNCDINDNLGPSLDNSFWSDGFGIIPGKSLFTRSVPQTSDGPYANNYRGNVTNLWSWGGLTLGYDGLAGIFWEGQNAGGNFGEGAFKIPVVNPAVDGGQRILYFGGPTISGQGSMHAISFQVVRTNNAATVHGLLAPRITFAFNHPTAGQYASWAFEMQDLTANNSTETGGGKQRLIHLEPNGNTPTNVYYGGPEWTNFMWGQRFDVATVYGLKVTNITGSASQFLKQPTQKHASLFYCTGSSVPAAVGDAIVSESSGGIENIVPSATAGVTRGNFSAGTNPSLFGEHGNNNYRVGRNCYFAISSYITNTAAVRVQMGLTDQVSVSAQTTADGVIGNYAVFSYSTSAGNTKWQCLTCNNTTVGTTDSGVTVDTAIHKFEIQFNDSVPNVVFVIDGAIVATRTTLLPSFGTNLRWVDGGFTLANVVKEIAWEYIYAESDR